MGKWWTASALAACLLAPGPLASNPDLGGRLWLSGTRQVTAFSQVTGADAYGTRFEDSFGMVSDGSLGLGAQAPLSEAFSAFASVYAFGSTYVLQEAAGPDGTFGKYQHSEIISGREVMAGLTLYTAGLAGRTFRPGEGNPAGPAWWPVLSLAYVQDNSQGRYTLDTATLGYTGSVAPKDYKVREQAYSAELALPLVRWLSVSGGFLHSAWRNVDFGDSTLAYGHPLERWGGGLELHVGGRPGRNWRDYFPWAGWPGSWNLGAGYSRTRWLNVAWPGPVTYSVSGACVVHGSTKLALGVDLVEQPPPMPWGRNFAVEKSSDLHSHLWVTLTFNLGYRGPGPADEAASAAPSAPADPGPPPAVDGPVLPPLDGDGAPEGAVPPPGAP